MRAEEACVIDGIRQTTRARQLAANPMQLVDRPKLARPLPKARPRQAVQALLDAVVRTRIRDGPTGWGERDLAIILTALLAGLRADELRQADVGDIRTTDDGAARYLRERQRRQGTRWTALGPNSMLHRIFRHCDASGSGLYISSL